MTKTVKINGMEKEFIIDTGSPISTMSVDTKLMKETEIQKMKHQHQDVNSNEVNFLGKTPVDIEYEKIKKMQILITERNVITPILGKDWLKIFKRPAGKIQLNDESQSQKKKKYRPISGSI